MGFKGKDGTQTCRLRASSQVRTLRQTLSARSRPDSKARDPVKEAGIGDRRTGESPWGGIDQEALLRATEALCPQTGRVPRM